ncbi:hypothetical protein [Streptomyces yanii]|uniref:Uncharacterized protein n=1 Tax=Streptomyces yanii TaxID=78510 RepID=A0ABV5RPK1_9ACTN
MKDLVAFHATAEERKILHRSQFRALLRGCSGFHPLVDVRAAHPLGQRHRMNTEVGGHLLRRHNRTAVCRDSHDMLAELFRIRLRRSDIFPTHSTGQAS